MKDPGAPLRWPGAWSNPALFDRAKDALFDTLLVDNSDEFEPVRSRAAQMGLQVVHPDLPPDGVRVLKGEWPGVRRTRDADAEAGPTGVPWVDSNGWKVRLETALHPEAAVWVDATPPQNTRPGSYLAATADAAAYGGRWIVTLDEALAGGIADGNESALRSWDTIARANAFFAAHREWNGWAPVATAGVVSDFAGNDEFFSHELLNLASRAGLHLRALPKDRLTATAMRGLRAALYADAQPPSAAVRREIGEFVQAGGLLITTPVWGDATSKRSDHPRYYTWAAGKGRIARAIEQPGDPFEMANDAVILISHRYDLVRFWNGGATGSSYAASPDGKRAVVHLLFYADRGPDSASVRVAGPYRNVKASTVDGPLGGVEILAQRDAVEVHLPRASQYVALELSL